MTTVLWTAAPESGCAAPAAAPEQALREKVLPQSCWFYPSGGACVLIQGSLRASSAAQLSSSVTEASFQFRDGGAPRQPTALSTAAVVP